MLAALNRKCAKEFLRVAFLWVLFGSVGVLSFSGRTSTRGVACRVVGVVARQGSARQNNEGSSSFQRHDVQELMEVLVNRYGSEPLIGWARIRNYFYRNADKVETSQLLQIIQFLESRFDEETQILVLKECPSILRKSVSTFLEPTADFLRNRFGEDLFREAIQRNPKLLLTRGVGYDTDVLDMANICLQDDLQLGHAKIRTLKKQAPFVFELPVSKILSTTSCLRQALSEGNNQSPQAITKMIGNIIVSHPELLRLSVEDNLKPRLDFLRSRCYLKEGDLVSMVKRSSSAVLGLSVDQNLDPTIEFLETYLSPDDLRRCVLSHAQVLGLSLDNLLAKAEYFDRIDPYPKSRKYSLVSRILVRSPEVFSLSLEENIMPKIEFLAGVWGVHIPKTIAKNTRNETFDQPLASTLKEYPSILSLSLEGNLRPTVNFFNRTGYILLNDMWRNTGGRQTKPLLRGRYMCTSLFNRLLPRYHFCRSQPNSEGSSIPLYILACATDAGFCEYLNVHVEDFKNFKADAIPRLKFSSQFDTWVKTGRPIDTE